MSQSESARGALFQRNRFSKHMRHKGWFTRTAQALVKTTYTEATLRVLK